MGLKLRELRMTLVTSTAEEDMIGDGRIVDIVAKKVTRGQDAKSVELWQVWVDPKLGGRTFELTGEGIDGFLSELVTYRGLVRKIEHILGDAERGG